MQHANYKGTDMTDYQKLAQEYAEDIIENMQEDQGEEYIYDTAHEYADGSEHVIYSKAHDMVAWMHQSRISYWESEIGAGGTFNGYDELACRIAYYELCDMITAAALKLFEEKESEAA